MNLIKNVKYNTNCIYKFWLLLGGKNLNLFRISYFSSAEQMLLWLWRCFDKTVIRHHWANFHINYDMVKFHSLQYIATNPRNYGRCLASVMYCQTPVDDYKEATDLRECWSSSWSCSIIICVLKSVFILLWPSHIFKGFEFCKLWITHQIIPDY